jgi:hypothetical protein
MNFILTQMALLILFSPVAVGQTLPHASDCSTLKYSRHKVSCLCGSVEICAGDICGSPSVYELDDDITVELRSKSGSILDTLGAQAKAAIRGHLKTGHRRSLRH